MSYNFYFGANPYSYFDYHNAISRAEVNAPQEDYILLSMSDDRPVTVDQVLEHIKVDADQAESDTYYESLILAATLVAEHMMRREIIEKTYRTYRNSFESIRLRKSPILSLDLFEAVDFNNVWQPISPDVYYMTESNNYSQLYINRYQRWPLLPYDRQQGIKIEFTVGMTTIFEDIKLGILHHIAVLNEQRGDWGSADLESSQLIDIVPAVSRTIYYKYRITNR